MLLEKVNANRLVCGGFPRLPKGVDFLQNAGTLLCVMTGVAVFRGSPVLMPRLMLPIGIDF